MKVALLYNARPEGAETGGPDDLFEEFDSDETIRAVAGAIELLGVMVEPVLAERDLPWRLSNGNFDFAFNIAEGEGRRCREAIPAAVCELLDIPFTGSDVLTLAVTLDKFIAKRIVSPDIPIARGFLVTDESQESQLAQLSFPVIVKPNDEGSSKGIRENPVARDLDEAVRRCRWLKSTYGCPVLVEEFLTGAEVTVAVTGNGSKTRVLGMMEIAPANGEPEFVYSLEVKRDFHRQVRYHIPPRLDLTTSKLVAELALSAYRLLGCRDIARIDFRLDNEGVPRFLECNPLPGLNPESGDIVILSKNDLKYESLVQGILLDAIERTGHEFKCCGGDREH